MSPLRSGVPGDGLIRSSAAKSGASSLSVNKIGARYGLGTPVVKRRQPPNPAKTPPDAMVAWLLIDAAAHCLTVDQRTMAFVELGCGEHHRAIERILAAVVEVGVPLPAAVLRILTTWLDLYAGSPEEQRLRTLLTAITPA